eukprot:TRINITY_DN2552_c0_g1_i3.p1 TRINITY_DN2552_c0_g1~~TRINITY_DN2552_c0_g1_i3.p1  ORF type:complete len:2043 (+),score=368.09 TRINITY_DN2552_c0_g1_i3:228-6131(+)
MIVCTVPWMIPTSTSLIVRVLSVDSLPFSCFVGIVTGSIESPILRAGHMFTCLGFAPLGIIRCWGDSQQGQFGLGTAAIIGDQPSEVPLSLSLQIAFDFFAVGAYHLCVARPGFLGCFGFNINGQLGNGNTNSYGDNPGETNPTNLLGTGEGVAGLALGGSHTCFIVDAPVQMRCTGQNDYGQLGVGSTTQSTTPLQVTLQGISSIAASVISFCAGDQHNCVMDDGGSVYCFGRNAEGQLGIGGVTPIGADPGDILAPVNLGGAAASVHCGGYHTCAVMGGGALRCFGLGNAGQLGNGGTSAIGDNSGEMPPTPTAIPKALRFFSTRSYTSCIVFADGDASCFGRNQFGGLGRGDTNNQVTVPSPINLGLSATTAKIATISPGQSHVCALRTDGDVVCWGQGSSGQLGVGNTLNIGDEPGEMPPALVMLPPFLISVGPSSVSRSSTLLTLSGTAFGNLASNVTVFVGASSCSISSISVVRITCLPAYVVGNYSVTVARNGFGVSNALGPIQFLPSISRTNSRSRTRTRTAPTRPVILGVTPAGGKPGDTISITGYQFGTTSDVTSVTICGTAAPLVSRSVDGSLVLAQIPSSLSPSACFVHVLKNTLIDLGSVSITVVQTFSLASALPTEGQSGTVVNITSLNGPFGGLPTLAQNDVTVVVASSQTATITQFSSNWLLAQMPVGAVGTVTLAVRLFGASWSSNNTVAFTYISTPTISSVYPPVAVPGASLMINGTGFGSNAALLSVSVGGLVCSNMAVLTADTSVSCTLSLSQPLATAASVTLARSSIIASGTQSIQIVSERAALVAFFTSTGGASWTTSTLWQSASSYCSWFGVTCAANGLNVISISLPNNNLVGNSFPSEMPNLFFLAALNLTGNSLSGSLVNTPLCDNDRLVSLDLKNNAFASALPSCFSTLQLLDLSHNAIDTTIPAEYGLSTTLQTLRLAENQLEGFLPTGGFPALRELDVFGNVLYGNLPTFGPLLQTVSIATNRFTGVLSAGSQLCAIPSALLGCNFFSSVCGVSTTLDPNADCVTRGAASAATKNTCERDGLYVDVFASACVSNCGLYAPVPLSNHTTQCQSVLVCTTGCSLCTGEGLEVVGGNCTLCDEPLGYALSLDGSVCTNSCGSNQTVNSQLNPDRCQCDYSNGFFPNAAKTECRRCAFSNQFIDSDDTCKFCHPDCQTCTGPTSGDCLSCPFGVEFRSSGGGCAGSCSSCLSSFVRYAGSTGCVCPPGTSLQAGSCVPCPADTYSPSYGIDNVCIPCGSHRGTGGLANRTAASDCVCKPTFDDLSGSCVCGLGKYYDLSTANCQFCPPDTYSTTFSLDNACTPCAAVGPYRTTRGQTGSSSSAVCQCQASMLDQGTCVCPAGSYLELGTLCRSCPPDTYSSQANTYSSCFSCLSVGLFRTTLGASGSNSPANCTCPSTLVESPENGACLCEPGYFYEPAARRCRICPADSYLSGFSAEVACTPCSSVGDHLTTSNRQGSTDASDCVCAANYFPLDGQCESCETLKKSATCQGAESGSLVLQNATLSERALASGIRVNEGYWLTVNPLYLPASKKASQPLWFDVVKCPVRVACPGGVGAEVCARGYEGPACGVCSDGYGRLGQECAKCPAPGASVFLLILILALLIAGCNAIVYFSRKDSPDGAEKGDDEGAYMQRLKIAITHLQIIGFTGNFASQWPQVLIRVFAVPASAATVASATDNVAIDCAAPASIYTHAVLIFLLPVILAVGVALGYFLVAARQGSFDDLVGKIRRGTLVLLYVAHPGIAQGVLKLLVCVDVGEKQYARSDMSVDCASSGFVALRAFSALYFVFYGFGGLALVFFLMKKDPNAFQFLTKGYRPDRFYWDLVVTVRKMIFVIISLFASAPLQLFFGTWVLLLSWVSQQIAHPYESNLLRKMDTSSVWVLLLTVTVGMLFYTDVLDGQGVGGFVVSILLILLNFVAVCIFVFLAARKGLKSLREAALSPL